MKQDAVKAIEKLVQSVASSAAERGTKVSQRIEALRVLAPYYAALKKHKIHATADAPDEVTIDGMQKELRNVEDEQTVSDHQRGNGSIED